RAAHGGPFGMAPQERLHVLGAALPHSRREPLLRARPAKPPRPIPRRERARSGHLLPLPHDGRVSRRARRLALARAIASESRAHRIARLPRAEGHTPVKTETSTPKTSPRREISRSRSLSDPPPWKMRTLDLYVARLFIFSWFVCAISFIGLFVTIEAFAKLDRFL